MNSKTRGPIAGALKASLSTLAAVLAIAVPAAGHAGDTRSMTVMANVVSQCQFQSAADMNFGNVDALAGIATPVTATVRIQCNRGATANLTSSSTESMAGTGGSTLAYNFAIGGGTAFNNCSTGTASLRTGAAAVGLTSLWAASGGPRDVTLCGTIPAGQAETRPGAHSETVVLTVTN